MNPIMIAPINPNAIAAGTANPTLVIKYAARHPVKATTDPTDKSNAPEINSNIIPTATIVSMDKFRSIWEKLSKVGNV
jgi:hypothetical protein